MDDVCTLIKRRTPTFDEVGNEIHEMEEREVFCQVYGITRSEFYQAAVSNLAPELTIRLSDYMDYHGEDLVRYKCQLYSVIRTYRDRGSMQNRRGGGYYEMDPNAIELIVGRKLGNVEEQ